MKVLNLYAGIGGNRKLWTDCEVTAVELDEATAEVYQKYFPNDKIIIADAHEFLLNNYKEYDFIWTSPPCPSHSDIRRCGVHKGQYNALYPDMGLYEEIILLQHFAKAGSKWVVENVIPYYEPLIKPTFQIDRHYYWSNFFVNRFATNDQRVHNDITGSSVLYGFSVKDTKIKEKRKALRNMVNPEIGLHIFNYAQEKKTEYINQTKEIIWE